MDKASVSPQAGYIKETFFGRLKKTPSLIWGCALLAIIVALAVLAPVICRWQPSAQNLMETLQPPSAKHLLGTDQVGRDLFARLIYAGRVDLRIMALAEVIPFCTGVFVGMLAGYYGKWVDTAVTLVTNTLIAFPYYLIVIIVAFASGAGERGIYITFALVGWIVYARVIRGLSASLCRQEWILSAKAMGLPGIRIIFRHLLPNVLPQAVVVLMTDMVGILVAIVTLGYLGIGITPPTPDWGTMISEGRTFIYSKWWLSVVPGLAVVVTGIALSFIGDGLADLWRKK